MKNLAEITELFVSARNLAKGGDPQTVNEAAEKLSLISEHCKELYKSGSYLEKAKCRNLFESIDNVVTIMKANGYGNGTVRAFFGFPNATGATFVDISKGTASVAASDLGAAVNSVPASNGTFDTDIASLLGDAPKATSYTDVELPPMPVSTVVPPVAPIAVDVNAPTAANGAVSATPSDADSTVYPTDPAPAAASADGVDTTVSPEPTGVIPVEIDLLEPQSLDEYIGQEHIVKRIKEEIKASKILGKGHLDNIMLFGNRGLGKSTLIELIAKEMGVELEFIDCTTFANNSKSEENFHSLFLNIIKKDRPVVIAFDEIHALTPKLQSRLLTLLQKREYAYVADGTTKIIPVKDFTFIGATTDYDAVLTTIKDRCSNLTFTMKDYNRNELSMILANKFAAMGLKADEKVIECCVNRFRNSLRDIKAIVMGIHTKAVITPTDVVTLEMAEEYFKDRGIDPIGLEEKELQILRIIRDEERGSISEDTLAARAYLDPKVLTKVHEPYLMKIGFISINSKGRSLTPKAEDYLKYGYYDFGDGVYVGQKPDNA